MFRNIHRLGKRDASKKTPRNVIVAFIHQPDVDNILNAVKELSDPQVNVRTDLPKKYNDIRNALLAIRKEYKKPENGNVKCKLTYVKFKPVLFKHVDGVDTKVEITKDAQGEYHEILDVDED
jgi:hypothetical protein